MEKRLISSYDEINDTFVGKIDGENGYCADYGISDGVFLGINNANFPSRVFVFKASKFLNTSKETLESADVKISINCNGSYLYFDIFIENSRIFSTKCKNKFGIPNLDYIIDSNY